MLQKDTNARFISILADGKFHETVPAGTDGATKREYETSDGKKGEKYELVYTEINKVKIVNVQFWDGDYGEQVQVTFADPDGNEVTLSQSVASNFGEDLLKKLPALDFSKEVAIKPYAFQDEKTGKLKKGVSVFQTDKVSNFFYDGEKNLHGFPTPKKQDMSKDEWKLYFLECRIFLVGFAKENIVPKFEGRDFSEKKEEVAEYPKAEDEGIDPASIPF